MPVKTIPLTLGLLALGAAWLGPLPALAAHAFAAHMTIHIIVVAVAAPLIAIGLAGRTFDPAARAPWLFAPVGIADGPLPAHYEPQESPVANLLYGQERNPARHLIGPAGGKKFPALAKAEQAAIVEKASRFSPSSTIRSRTRARFAAAAPPSSGRRGASWAGGPLRACWNASACARTRSSC